jgi:hypothetical protein
MYDTVEKINTDLFYAEGFIVSHYLYNFVYILYHFVCILIMYFYCYVFFIIM